ncbi:MAG: T9SS C-terminal target domain-containing protein [uncultured Aureispira sp.]|uniref:T9SS C-terminal target domain-containing protein n=1 Tax=uncultured Aureispira sp. TaxID=1331704 RepID=A0A6S6TUJ3_9BACT|nr:MAG: T9SS C-terminal target domain-containing protein [uncultured Aureispira sp.]
MLLNKVPFSLSFYLSILSLLSIAPTYAQNNNGLLDQIEELGTKLSVPIRAPGGVDLATDVYLPITTDSLVINTTVLGQNISLELIPKGTQIVVYPEMIDSTGNWVPNPNPYQLPIILTRTPYGKEGLGGAGSVIPLFGYVYANQDVRGKEASEGVYLPMYSDGWKKAPYHNYNHLLDIINTTDSTNGRFHEDGWTTYQYLLNGLKKDFDLDGDGINETNSTIGNGTIGTFGASAFAIPHFQLMASNYIDPSPNVPGFKGNIALIATGEHYNTTGFHNGVFRQGLAGQWLKKEMETLQDSIGADNSLTNALHTPFDYALPTKADVLHNTLEHYTGYKYPNSTLANAYPSSIGRAEMDISAAPINANGFGDSNGTFSRYNNMNVPTYHLTGWYDLFVDGQIKTWRNLKTHTNTHQKIIIGPWAHTSITMNESGDLVYPKQVSDLLGFDASGVGFGNISDLDFSKVLGSEPIEFLRYTLNSNGYVKLGDPVIRIPESNTWQGNNLKVRIPSENYDLTLIQVLNFVAGQGSLPDIPVEAQLGILPAVNVDIPFPNVLGLLPALPFSLDAPIAEPKDIDFDTVPDIRFYVIGPTDSLVGNETVGNYWYASTEFPLSQGVNYTPFYLHQNGLVDGLRPTVDEGNKSYVHDPNSPVRTVGGGNLFIENPDGRDSHGQMNLADSSIIDSTLNHPGVIQFETMVLNDTFSMIGIPKATLYAASEPQLNSSGETDTDFFVRILDVYPDGKEYLVIEGAINARARVYAKSLYDDNEDNNALFSNIQVGQVYEYQFNLLPIAYTFGKQHKMKVLISSSNYPRYMANPNIPLEDGDFFRRTPNDGQTYTFQNQTYSARIADNSIYFSDSLASRLELPIYGRNPFTINVDKINNEADNSSIYVSPNPATDYLLVTLTESTSGLVSVYNALGQLVLQTDMTTQTKQLDVQNLAAGVYRLHFEDATTKSKQVTSFVKR